MLYQPLLLTTLNLHQQVCWLVSWHICLHSVIDISRQRHYLSVSSKTTIYWRLWFCFTVTIVSYQGMHWKKKSHTIHNSKLVYNQSLLITLFNLHVNVKITGWRSTLSIHVVKNLSALTNLYKMNDMSCQHKIDD